jgi:hypothetical protein
MNPKPTTQAAASEPGTVETRATRSDTVQPPSGRQLLIALRADLLAPIEAMVGYSQLLADDTGDRPPEFQEDVAKLQGTAKRLYQFVKQKLNIASQSTTDTRLIGRSVWNTQWLLIIPGGTLLADPDAGLDRFIDDVTDIKLFFQTYAYSGN